MNAAEPVETIKPDSGPKTETFGLLGLPGFMLVLAAMMLLSFPETIFGSGAWFYRDYGVLAYPGVAYHRAAFWQGELPQWNPLSHCGVPFLAQWGTMVLYPGALMYLLLPLPWSLGAFCLAHVYFGGVGMYVLGRRLSGDRLGASAAGVAWAFQGLSLASLIWPNYAVAMGWMPWVVWTAERAWSRGGLWVVPAVFAFAMQILSGAPEAIGFTILIVGLFWVARLNSGEAGIFRSGFRLALVAVFAFGLTALQWLPFLELLEHSHRTRNFATSKWALPPMGQMNLFFPRVATFITSQGMVFQRGQEFFSSVYMGGAMVAMGCAGLRRGRVWVIGLLAFLAPALALGDRGILYPLLKSLAPWLGVARYPVKWLLITAFCVPLLAALGIAALRDPETRPRFAPWPLAGLAAGGIALVGGTLIAQDLSHRLGDLEGVGLIGNTLARLGFLAGAMGAMWLAAHSAHARLRMLGAAALLASLWLDFATHTAWQNPVVPPALFAARLAELEPRPLPGLDRVFIHRQAEDELVRSRVSDFEADFVGKRLALWSNLHLLEGVPKVNGASTLQVREQAQVQDFLLRPGADAPAGWLDFLSVSYVTSRTNVLSWSKRGSALPWLTGGQAPVYGSESENWNALQTTNFIPQKKVWLPVEARYPGAPTGGGGVRITPRLFSPENIEAEVVTTAAAWVVLAQSWYPAWEASVDGKPVRIWKANHAFQAVAVPAGTHRLRFQYRDARWIAGLWTSGVTLVILMLFGVLMWILGRRAPAASGGGGGAVAETGMLFPDSETLGGRPGVAPSSGS